MNYQEIADSIVGKIGGVNNIKHMTHCATRLRMSIVNNKKVEKDSIGNISGVLGVVESGGQLQVILGQHVSHVFSAIQGMQENSDTSNNVVTEEAENTKQGIIPIILDTITGIFTPVLSAITGAAMVKTLVIVLTLAGLLSKESQTYVVLNFISDAAFLFLPMMLAYSAAQKFKMNTYVAMTLSGVLLHPVFMGMVKSNTPISFLDMNIPLVPYGSTVIPIILVIWFASYIERMSEKVSPKAILFFMKPFMTLLIVAPIALLVIAPLGVYVGKGLGFGIDYVNAHVTWLLPIIFGVFSPIFVMTGMHYAVTIPIVLTSIAAHGFDMAGAGFLMANIAEGAAALAVARLAKDTDFKAMANSAGFTGLLGITEPALYGVNLKYRKPFYAVMIAGGIAGLYVGVNSVKRLSFAPTGITTLPIFIDPQNSMNIVHAIIGLAISFTIAYVLTTIFMRKDARIK